MGETQHTLFQPDFNRSVKVESRAERLTADAGVLLLREILDRSGLSRLLAEQLTDYRDPDRVVHPLPELIRTQLLLDAQGYPDQLDATVLRHDPLYRLSVSSRRGQAPLGPAGPGQPDGLASQPTLSRTLEMLADAANRSALAGVLLRSADVLSTRAAREPQTRTWDLDSLPVEVHGHQPGSAFNGHYRCRCYHPLVLRDERGFFLAARLREGKAYTADGALEFVLPMVTAQAQDLERLWLRIDAGFPADSFLSALEKLPTVRYVARLRSNPVLERQAAPYLRRPPGRPPAEGRIWLHELLYQGREWDRPRRVVLVVLERPGEQEQLFLDRFFLVTNASVEEMPAEALLEHYRGRGGAEKDFGEWQNALSLALSSSPRPKSHYRGRPIPGEPVLPDSFAANEARLLLSLLAANLLQAGAQLLASRQQSQWSRERFRRLVLKAAGRVVTGGRTITVIIDRARAPWWSELWRELARAWPTRGSPKARALPAPA